MESWREQARVDRTAFAAAGKHGFLMVWPQEKHGGMAAWVAGEGVLGWEYAKAKQTPSHH